jgi:hypothetical protein
MNPIYDETYMGEYRTPFNTILEQCVRILRKLKGKPDANLKKTIPLPYIPHPLSFLIPRCS